MRSVSMLMQLVLLLSMFAEFTTGSFEQHYIGCYRDNRVRAMEIRVDNQMLHYTPLMTHEKCRELCTTYTYFGVQNSYECFCDHKYNRYGRRANCNMNCTRNRSQICGGAWSISVYSVCPFGFYGLNCTDRCYCQNTTQHDERCFMNGTCPVGCQAGWTGPTCATDICMSAKCHHICVNTSGSHSCACYEGYTLDANGTNCIVNLPSVDNATAVWVVVVPSVVAGLAIIAVVALFCYITRLRSRHTTADVTAPPAAGAVLNDYNKSPIYYEVPIKADARGIIETGDGNGGQRTCDYSRSTEYMELNQRHYIEAVYEQMHQS